MKKLLYALFLVTASNSFSNYFQDCNSRLCYDFDTYITKNKVNDELHIDVTILKLVEIRKEEKQIFYEHKFQNLVDINIQIDFNNNGYVSYAKIWSLKENYDFDICFAEINANNFNTKDKLYIEISEHVSCILEDCNFFSNRI